MASLATRGFIALDGMYGLAPFDLAERIADKVYGVKVHSLLYGERSAMEVITRLKALRLKVWADVKAHDIPQTAYDTVKRLARCGADLVSVHQAGDIEMVEAAVAGFRDAGVRDVRKDEPGMGVIAITVLTSINPRRARHLFGNSLAAQALLMAQDAHRCGAFGVVCSPKEVASMRGKFSRAANSLKLVTPGVRSPATETHDQVRVDTPADALSRGADYLVIGREVTTAGDPLAVIAKIDAAIAHLP